MQIIFKKLTNYARHNAYPLAIVIILLLAFFLRLPYAFTERMWPDEALYAWYAERIFHEPAFLFSGEIAQFHPPLYPLLLALGHSILPSQLACQWLALLFGVLGIWTIYRLGIRLGGPFIGLVSASLLALNPVYTRYSTKILADFPQIILFMLLMIGCANVTQKQDTKLDLKIGSLLLLIILLKASGIMAVAFVAIYYVIVLNAIPWRQRLKRISIPCAMGIAAVMLYVCQQGGFSFYRSALENPHFDNSPMYYLIYLPDILGFPVLIPFLILGVIVTHREKKQAGMLLLPALTLIALALAVTAEKTMRYSLILLPVLLILISFGLEWGIHAVLKEVSRSNKAKTVIGGICLLALILNFPFQADKLKQDNKFFKGYPEAGQWIKEHMTADTLIIATSHRNMRYHAKIDIDAKGGKVVPYPREKAQFEKLITDNSGHIILEIANWGNPFQTAIDPFSDKDIEYFAQWGFELKKTCSQMRYRTSTGTRQVAPAIWLFERNKAGNSHS